MSKKFFTQEEYSTPEAAVICTEVTGMLCQSITTSVEGFSEDSEFGW